MPGCSPTRKSSMRQPVGGSIQVSPTCSGYTGPSCAASFSASFEYTEPEMAVTVGESAGCRGMRRMLAEDRGLSIADHRCRASPVGRFGLRLLRLLDRLLR